MWSQSGGKSLSCCCCCHGFLPQQRWWGCRRWCTLVSPRGSESTPEWSCEPSCCCCSLSAIICSLGESTTQVPPPHCLLPIRFTLQLTPSTPHTDNSFTLKVTFKANTSEFRCRNIKICRWSLHLTPVLWFLHIFYSTITSLKNVFNLCWIYFPK